MGSRSRTLRLGYKAVRALRERAPDKRGGGAPPDDGFDHGPATLAGRVDEYLEDMRLHNRTPDAVETRHNELRVFLRWAEERGLFDPRQITRTILESYQRRLWHYRKRNDKPLCALRGRTYVSSTTAKR